MTKAIELPEQKEDVTVKKYFSLFQRVEYPQERGYRTEPVLLPNWIYVTITEQKQENNKFLTVYSRIHMNKEVKMNPSYSAAFSDEDILKDLSGEISSRFL